MQPNTMDWAKLEIIAAFTLELRQAKALISSLAESAYCSSHHDERDQMYNALLGVESMIHTLETVKTKETIDYYFTLITIENPTDWLNSIKK
jgi:hypothetical protein